MRGFMKAACAQCLGESSVTEFHLYFEHYLSGDGAVCVYGPFLLMCNMG